MKRLLTFFGLLLLVLTGCPTKLDPDFKITPTSAFVSVAQGSSAQISINLERINSFGQTVTVSLGSPPSGISATPLDIGVVTDVGTLTINAASTALVGSSFLTLNATGGGITHALKVDLQVSKAVPPSTISISNLGSTVYTKGNLTVQVAVTGNPSSVELLKNNALLVSLNTPYTYIWDTSTETEGAYTLTARATPSNGTPVVSSPVTVNVDRTSPFIIAQIPANKATNIYLADPINWTFSEPLAVASVNAGTVDLSQNGLVISSDISLDNTGTKISLKPLVLPAIPIELSMYLGGVTDRAGNALTLTNTTFIAPDWQAPGTQPLDISTNQHAAQPSMAIDSSGNMVVAWEERDVNLSNYLYVKRYNGSTWNLVGSTFLNTNAVSDAYSPSLALDSSGNMVVAWEEINGGSGSFDIYVKRFDGTTWNLVGNTSLDVKASNNNSFPSLALDSSGKPVVAFEELDSGGVISNIYVKRFDGSNWNLIGRNDPAAPGKINFNEAHRPSIALDASGNPVVAYGEFDGTFFHVFVKHYDGSTWNSVGTGTLNQANSQSIPSPAIALDSGGNPIVAWNESLNGQNLYAKRWNGGTWNLIGSSISANSSPSIADFPSLALDSSNNPFVAWLGYDGNYFKIYVHHWNGSAWDKVGQTFPDVNPNDNANNPSLALDAKGKPVVSWDEGTGTSNNIYVKRYNRIP